MRWLKVCILALILSLLVATPALAATSADVTVTASGLVVGGPSGFTLTRITDYEIGISWTKAATANNTMIRRVTGRYPEDRNDGIQVYYGTGTNTTDFDVDLDSATAPYYYRAWSEDSDGVWSTDYDEGWIGGSGVTLIALGLLAMGLTVAMFHTRNSMLGFPSAIMWAILGAYAYTESTIPWGDWQFFLFFASAFGMVIFTALAAYGLREKRDTLADEEMGKGEGEYIGEEKGKDDIFAGLFDTEEEELMSSERTLALREKARQRRTGEHKPRRIKWKS